MYPEEFLTIPVVGEPDITKNFSSVKQDWCNRLQLHKIHNNDYTLKEASLMLEGKHPLEVERNALKSAVEDNVNSLKIKAYGHNLGIGTQIIRPALKLFNIYEIIVFK